LDWNDVKLKEEGNHDEIGVFKKWGKKRDIKKPIK